MTDHRSCFAHGSGIFHEIRCRHMEKETWLIVGLGNTGAQYAHTRHNAGFDAVQLLADAYHLPISKSRCRGLVLETNAEIRGETARLVLCQPQTLMNLSGECVSPLLNWYKAPLDHLLVICDDIDLPLGQLRLRKKGSPGTHNGLRNIVQELGTQDFARLRVGVGAPGLSGDLVDWVLGRPRTNEEAALMAESLRSAADCARAWLEQGIDRAMSIYNRKTAERKADESSTVGDN